MEHNFGVYNFVILLVTNTQGWKEFLSLYGSISGSIWVGGQKYLEIGTAEPGALVHPMEDEDLEKVMWNVLQKFGLDERKLAVFDVSESGVIAGQICEHLGLICEGCMLIL